MTKNEFLSELENALEGRLSADDITEIIEDYRDIFESGISEGKSEELIYSEIGSPAKIARKILEDEPVGAEAKKNSLSGNEAGIEEQKLSSLSRRFGAFFTDTVLGAFLLTAILFLVFIPFSANETVTTTGGNEGYSVTMHQNEKGVSTKIEVRNSSGKRLFKGNNKEFEVFLKNNNIRYPEDFSSRTYITWSKGLSSSGLVIISSITYMIMFAFLGIGNIFNVFLLWKFNGYTIGKRLFKIRVVKQDGTALRFSDAVLRELVIKTIVNAITGGLLNIASFIWACVTDGHKTVHDVSSKTKVISVKG